MKDSERMKNSWILFIRYCLLFVIWDLLFIFLSVVPAHAYWIQYDWSGGDSQCLWYDTTRYDTNIYIESDESPPAKGENSWNDTAVKVIEGKDTGVLLSSTYDADSPVVWKTIEWNFPSNDNELTDASGSNPFSRGDSRLRKDEKDLVALWHFDEGFDVSGKVANDSTVYDESANSNTGIVHGCVWGKWTVPSSTANAVFGSALSFDWNNSDYVTFGKAANSIKTIEFWIKTDSADTPILELNDSADTVYVSGGNVAASFADTTIYIDGNQGTALGTGSWHHVAVTKTTTGIDGSNISIGKAGSDYFSGAIDEVAIYSRAKTAQEIWQDARGTQIHLRTQTTSSILDGTGSDSPVALWHFDNLDNSSTSRTAHDSSVYDNDGAWDDTGPVWYQYGVFGKCLQFDGADDYVDCGNDASLQITDEITVELWFRTINALGDQMIITKDSVAYSDRLQLCINNNFQTLRWILKVGTDSTYVESNRILADNEWYHIAAVYNGSQRILYINGAEVGSNSITGSLDLAYNNLLIGKVEDLDPKYFLGAIDEVGIYNYARTPKQIAIDARGWSNWSPYYKSADEDDIVLFKDDFNDGETSGWTSPGSDPWLIDNITDDTGALKITVATSDDTGIIYVPNNTDWYNYQVETKVKLETNTQAGIILNWNGTTNGYVALFDLAQLRIYAMKADGAAGAPLETYTFSSPLTASQWYTLKAQYDGSNIRVYIGDTNYITKSVSYIYKGYAAGLLAGTTGINGKVCFDNFKVFPIDRYCRYEATLTDNICNDTTPYLYWVRLGYEETTRDDTLWSRIWQDRYGLHRNDDGFDVPWVPEDQDSAGSWTWDGHILNYAEIDSADTTWCYNLENYDDDKTIPFNNPDGKLRVFVEVPVPATEHVKLRLGYRKTAALTTPGTWSDNETDYKWDDGDDWIRFKPPSVYEGDCVIEYDALLATPTGDTQIWKCTFSEIQITNNFSKEAGYILWSRAVSSEGNTEPSPETFEPDSSGNRQDTSIIYMMRDITPPGSSVEGWPWYIGESGYQPVSGIKNNNWIGIGDARLKIKGVQSSDYPDGTEGWYINSKNTWINFDSSQNDSGILVSVEDKNPDSTRENDCSGLKEKSSSDSPTRYVYSTTACGREWRHPDYVSPIDITDINDWAECDTDYNITIADDIRYLALGTGSHSMPNLGTRSSKEGRDILIQFAQKDKAGNWGYSHPDYSEYQADDSPGYYINYDITKPVPRIISAPREANPSKYASFKFDDDSADDSSLFCAFSTRLERNTSTDRTDQSYSTDAPGHDFPAIWPGGLPTSDNASTSFPITYSPYWYRYSVKAKDEALNESDDYDTYYFQCMPVPNTIIYWGPSGIITSSSGSYNATFKFEGEGGSETPYEFAYSINGSDWDGSLGTTTTKEISSLGYGNHVFRVRARNYDTTDGDAGTDKTPASVAFTIVNPAQLPTIASPSNPVKYWRQESE